MTATIADINAAGFISFRDRDYSFRGNRGTWARYSVETRELAVQCASTGRISEAYSDEMREFCSRYGIDWDAMRSGQRAVVVIDADNPDAVAVAENVRAVALDADARMDVAAHKIGKAEHAIFRERADRELVEEAEGAREQSKMYSRAGQHGKAYDTALHGARLIRRWTLCNNPEILDSPDA